MALLRNLISGGLPLAGSAIGNMFLPGIGGALGGIGGQGLSALLGHLYPEQQQGQGQQSQNDTANNYLLQQLMGQQGPVSFEGTQNEALRRYREQTVPELANRFAGMGGLRSSGFRNALASSGQELESRLAALRDQSNLQREQLGQNRLGLLGNYLTGQNQLGLQQQRMQQEQNNWLPTISSIGNLALGVGGLGSSIYNASQDRGLNAALARLGQSQQAASYRPNPSVDITFGTGSRGLLS